MAREFSFISQHETHATSASELMELAGLDWTVSLNRLYASGSFDVIDVPDKFATVKTDKNNNESVLSVVGSRYKVFQNSEIFSPLDRIVSDGSGVYGNAGELGGGKVVWATVKLPNPIHVGNDEHMGYIVARTSHDGSTPFQMTPMLNRIGCTNQINAMMMSGKTRGLYYSVRHSLNSVIDNDTIISMYRNSLKDITEYANVSRWLLGEKFNDGDFASFTRMVYPMPSLLDSMDEDMLSPTQVRTRNKILSARTNALTIWNGETLTQEGIAGTKFAAFQSIVEATDWNGKPLDKIEANILTGKDIPIKARALELLRG